MKMGRKAKLREMRKSAQELGLPTRKGVVEKTGQHVVMGAREIYQNLKKIDTAERREFYLAMLKKKLNKDRRPK